MANHTALIASIQCMVIHCCSCKYFLEHFLCLFILVDATLKAAFGITFPRKIRIYAFHFKNHIFDLLLYFI
jgi:hypothetical protein